MCHRERDVNVASLLQHHVGEIVGRNRVIRLDCQSFLVILLSRIPFLFGFVELANQNIEADVAGIILQRLLVRGNCLIGVTFRSLYLAQLE